MALLKFLKGNYAGLNNAAIKEGQVLICGDTGEMFVDVAADKRVKIGDFITVANIAALEALDATAVPTSRLYYVEDGNILARSNGTAWVQVNKQKTADELKTMLGLGTLAYKSEVAEADLNAALKEKVNAAAEGNHSHANKTVLDGITAEKVAAWDAAEQNAKDHADTELAKKVDKVEGKSLIADTEIARLAAMSDGANKVEVSETNGNIKIDGAETTVYTHPDKHAIADVDGLQDALDGKQAAGDYATKTEAQDYANAKDEAIAAAKKAGDDAQKTIDDYKTANDAALALKADKSVVDAMYTNDAIDTAVQGAKDYAKDLVDAIPAQTDYTVTITETTDGLDDSVAKKYTFTQNGAEIGSINLAKELVVTAGSVKEVETADTPYAGAVVGDKYIELVIANQDAPIYVPAKDLVDIYTAKDGAAEVQVAISNTNEISATLVNGGITEEKLAEAVKTKLNKTWEEVGVAKGLVDALADGQVKTNTEAIEALEAIDHDAYIAADTALKTELEGKIVDGDAATLEAAKTDASNKDAVVLAEAQSGIAAVQTAIDTYKTDNDAAVALKANASDVYIKTEIENLMSWGEF